MTKQILVVLGLSLCIGAVSATPAMGQFELRMGGAGGGFSRSVSVTNENGMKVTRVTENGKKFVIRQGDELIEVEFANTYGPNDMEKLKEKHPDLHMHVTSFPSKSGDSKVELTVSVKEKVSAENESALKEKSEAAYEVFEKYTKKGAAGLAPRIIGRGIDLGFEAKPLKLIEIEADAKKRFEDIRKKLLEDVEMKRKLMAEPKGFEKLKGIEKKEEPKKKEKKKDLIDA